MSLNYWSEILENLIEVLVPKVAKRVDPFALGYQVVFLHKGVGYNSFGHWHVNVHCCLHSHVFLEFDICVVVECRISLSVCIW